MKIKIRYLIISVLSLVLLSACSDNKVEEPQVKQYVIEEGPSTVTFEIAHKTDNDWLYETREKRNKLNEKYFDQDLAEEQKGRYIDKKTRNWRREIDGETIIGYNEDHDDLFYKFKSPKEIIINH